MPPTSTQVREQIEKSRLIYYSLRCSVIRLNERNLNENLHDREQTIAENAATLFNIRPATCSPNVRKFTAECYIGFAAFAIDVNSLLGPVVSSILGEQWLRTGRCALAFTLDTFSNDTVMGEDN